MKTTEPMSQARCSYCTATTPATTVGDVMDAGWHVRWTPERDRLASQACPSCRKECRDMTSDELHRYETITATCPAWCESDHRTEAEHGLESSYVHGRDFGDEDGANVTAYAIIALTGVIESTEFAFNIADADTPDDMDEVAEWCRAAAAFMRQIRAHAGLDASPAKASERLGVRPEA